MKKKLDEALSEAVILLHRNGETSLVSPRLLSEKVRKPIRELGAEYVLIQTGTGVPSYAFIETENLPKRFTPFRIRYKMNAITNNIGGATAADIDCKTIVNEGNWVNMECKDFPTFIGLLYSMQRIYSLSTLMSSKYDNVNDYEISNRKLVIGDIEVFINGQHIISPKFFQRDMGSILVFLSGALDYTSEQLLEWVNPPKKLFSMPKRVIIHTRENRWSFISVKWFEEAIAPSDDSEYMVSALSMFRNDLIFIHITELAEFNRFNICGGETRLAVYMSNNDHTFEETLDHPLNVMDVMQHPEVFYIQHAVTRTLVSLDDLLTELSTAKYFILMERIVLDLLGIDKDCEIVMDVCAIPKKATPFIMSFYGHEAFEEYGDPISEFTLLLAQN